MRRKLKMEKINQIRNNILLLYISNKYSFDILFMFIFLFVVFTAVNTLPVTGIISFLMGCLFGASLQEIIDNT